MKTMRKGLLAGVGALALCAAAPHACADTPGRVAQAGGVRMGASREMGQPWLLATTVAGLSVAMGMLGAKRTS